MTIHPRLLLAATLVAASLGSAFVSRDARAQQVEGSAGAPARAPAPAAAEATRWYGYETLLVDGAALGVMAAGLHGQSTAVGYAGLGLYALGPSMVHAAHGRGDVALGDLGLRVAAPITAGAIGYALDYGTSSPCTSGQWLCFRGLGGLMLGTAVGYVSAVIVDAVWLSREPAPRPREDEVADAARVRWSPVVGVTTQGATAGVGGVF